MRTTRRHSPTASTSSSAWSSTPTLARRTRERRTTAASGAGGQRGGRAAGRCRALGRPIRPSADAVVRPVRFRGDLGRDRARAGKVLGAPPAGVLLRRYRARRTAGTGSVLVTLGILGLSCLALTRTAPGVWGVSGVCFAVLGAGFTAVMVTATGTIVGDAPAGYAGVVGGLKQTAMNIGPTLGIAIAATLMQAKGFLAADPASPRTASAQAAEAALLALGAVAALGLLPALLLPTRVRSRRPAVDQCHRGAGRAGPRLDWR
ncbi:MFS transporter [Spirillospora sp. CA-128828]|uniref:MFS transporter n=1 Tax=Spirillospora sp. CA-128828 TaxID=3240033 RepID=UPI003D8D90F2